MTKKTKIVKKGQHVISKLGEKSVILDIETNKYYSFDAVANDIYSKITDEAQTLEAIADIVLAEYDIEKETLIADMLELFAKFEKAGLIALARE